jgi:hypothetical protein
VGEVNGARETVPIGWHSRTVIWNGADETKSEVFYHCTCIAYLLQARSTALIQPAQHTSTTSAKSRRGRGKENTLAACLRYFQSAFWWEEKTLI